MFFILAGTVSATELTNVTSAEASNLINDDALCLDDSGNSVLETELNSDDAIHVKKFVKTNSKLVVRWECADETSHEVVDSGSRFGYCLVKANLPDDIDKIKILLN